MPEAGPEAYLLHPNLTVGGIDIEPIQLQGLRNHLGNPVGRGPDIDLVGGKHLCEALLVINQLIQLVPHGNQHGLFVAVVANQLQKICNRTVQLLAHLNQLTFQLRQIPLNFIIPVLVRRNTGNANHTAINTVELGDAVLHVADDVGKFSQHHLHADGVFPCIQIKPVGIPLLVGQNILSPVGGIGKAVIQQLRKGGGLPAVPARAVDKEEDGSRFRPPEGGGSGSDGEGKLVHRGSFLPGGAGQGGHGKALFRQ